MQEQKSLLSFVKTGRYQHSQRKHYWRPQIVKNDLDALSKFIFLILRKQYLTLLYCISLFQLCDYKTCNLMSLLIFLFDLYLWAWFLFYIASLIIITLPTIAVAIGRCRSLSLCKVKAKSKGRWFDIVYKIKKK